MAKTKKIKLPPEPMGPRISEPLFDPMGRPTKLRDKDEIGFTFDSQWCEVKLGRPGPKGTEVISVGIGRVRRKKTRINIADKDDAEILAKLIATVAGLDVASYVHMKFGRGILIFKLMKRKKR
jgi:hypothetical protein